MVFFLEYAGELRIFVLIERVKSAPYKQHTSLRAELWVAEIQNCMFPKNKRTLDHETHKGHK